MPRILTTCPTSGAIVPTGHRTSGLDIATMDSPRSFRCPTCQQVHTWTGEQAQVENVLSLPGFRSAA